MRVLEPGEYDRVAGKQALWPAVVLGLIAWIFIPWWAAIPGTYLVWIAAYKFNAVPPGMRIKKLYKEAPKKPRVVINGDHMLIGAVSGIIVGVLVWVFTVWALGLVFGLLVWAILYFALNSNDVGAETVAAPPPTPSPAGFDEAALRAALEVKWNGPAQAMGWDTILEPFAVVFICIVFVAIISPLFFTMQTKVSTIVGWILTVGISLGLLVFVVVAMGEANTQADRRRELTDRIDAEVETARQAPLEREKRAREWAVQAAAGEKIIGRGEKPYLDSIGSGRMTDVAREAAEDRLEALEKRCREAIAAQDESDEAVTLRAKAEVARAVAAILAGQEADMRPVDVTVKASAPAGMVDWVWSAAVRRRQDEKWWIVKNHQWEVDKAKREREAMEQAAAAKALEEKLSKPIPLRGSDMGVVFGTNVGNGKDVVLDVRKIPHLLVVGTTGFGKSVFLHQLISQLVRRPEAGKLYLVDMKGGLEFLQYRSHPKVRVVGQYEDVQATVSHLLQVMKERTAQMVAEGVRSWRGEQIFFIVDEFAQIQLMKPVTKGEKEAKERLLADLNSVAMLGRAPGITVVAAIQKPTTDVMDSSFRTNLAGQVCFRVPSRAMASSMFPNVEDLPADPVTLSKGRCLFYNPNTGTTRELQVHVAPEAAD